MSQINTNPYRYSDSNKRYYTYNYYLYRTYGEKCAKITLDCNMTCPNIDGTKGFGGCIYCSNGSKGVTCDSSVPLDEQYKSQIEIVRKKWKVNKFIPYLQSHTNTYTSVDNLRKILKKVCSFENSVEVDIATRADCLENDKIRLLGEFSQMKPITVELGLQTSNDSTARIINRCHCYAEFVDCVERLRKYTPDVKIGIHIINGLPDETEADMIKTATSVAGLKPDFLKIHLLHVLKNTKLETMYNRGEYAPMSRSDYIRTVCDQIELQHPETVIERLTGDGVAEELTAPEWSLKKVMVINDIDKELFSRNSYQGIKYKES